MATLKLHSVDGWTTDVWCAPTAICAVTGCPPSEAFCALRRANPSITDFRSIAPRDWSEAFKNFGVTCRGPPGGVLPFERRDDIEVCLQRYRFAKPVLVMAYPRDEAIDDHVFATCDGMIVDTYTSGQVARFRSVLGRMPEALKHLRVKRVVSLLRTSP